MGRSANAYVPSLPDDVALSVQEVTRAKAPPEGELPPWLAKILPKTGIAGQAGGGMDDEFDEFLDMDEEEGEEPAAVGRISFEVRRGHGLGVLGADGKARDALLRILVGAIPPTTGRVVARGRVASMLRMTLNRYLGNQWGRKGVFTVAGFLHWPKPLLRKRWEQITEFAAIEELAARNLPTAKFRIESTRRLLLAAALHIDADVYVLDHAIDWDPEFAVKCVEALEQRRDQGAAVVQGAQMMIEDVARLCDHAIWLENGAVAYGGAPLEVAMEVHKNYREKLHPLSLPVTGRLAGDRDVVDLSSDGGGALDFVVHVLRKNLVIGLALELEAENGKTIRLEQPEPLRPEMPGVYRVRVAIPAGLLPGSSYSARLIREVSTIGGEPSPPMQLVAFELAANGAAADPDEEASSLVAPVGDTVLDESDPRASEVEWHVTRAPD